MVAAYPTNPDYDYAGNALDFSETGDQGEKVLGRTHDPSLIEVRNERGESIYYMFSTGWSDQSVYNGVTTYGNAIHVSYDGMKTWGKKISLSNFPGMYSYPDGFIDENNCLYAAFEFNRHDIYFFSYNLNEEQ